MEKQALLTADYLDILFENRNKLYGGYQLRKNYRQQVAKALSGVFIIVAIAIAYFQFTEKEQNAVVPRSFTPTIIEYIKPEIIVPPLAPVIPPPPPEANNAMIDYSNPEIVVDNEIVENELASVDDIDGKQIGTENVEGTLTNTGLSVSPVIGSTGGVAEAVDISTPKIERWVDSMPEFDGSLKQYLERKLKYPQLARERNVIGRVTVEFIVNEDGIISNTRIVKGIGAGCDEEALRVVNAMPKWRPGKQNGKPVKVYLILPISFQLY